jgi:hypothetical protein
MNTSFSLLLMGNEAVSRRPSNIGTTFDLGANPDPQLQEELKLLREVVPPVVVADGMRWQEVLSGLAAATALSLNVVGLPVLGGINLPTADVAAAARLREDVRSLGRCEAGAAESSMESSAGRPDSGEMQCAEPGSQAGRGIGCRTHRHPRFEDVRAVHLTNRASAAGDRPPAAQHLHYLQSTYKPPDHRAASARPLQALVRRHGPGRSGAEGPLNTG